VSSIRQKTTLKKTVAENFCTLMKAAHLSNFNLVMQISPEHLIFHGCNANSIKTKWKRICNRKYYISKKCLHRNIYKVAQNVFLLNKYNHKYIHQNGGRKIFVRYSAIKQLSGYRSHTRPSTWALWNNSQTLPRYKTERARGSWLEWGAWGS